MLGNTMVFVGASETPGGEEKGASQDSTENSGKTRLYKHKKPLDRSAMLCAGETTASQSGSQPRRTGSNSSDDR